MNTDTPPRRANRTALTMLLVGVIAGVAGGVLFSGYLPGLDRQPDVPEADLASGAQGAQNSSGERTITRDTGSGTGAGSGGSVQIPAAGAAEPSAPAADPLAAEALRAILERRATEEARVRERAQLAHESPLTPPATDLADRIRNWRDQAAEGATEDPAQDLAQNLAGSRMASAAETAGTPGAAGAGQVAPAGFGSGVQPSAGPANRSSARSPALRGPTHLLARGSVIPAVLETRLDSDLPGLVRARVSHDVYDTLTGSHVLIPRGVQLVGTYGDRAQGGQRRLFVSWTDLRLPDGTPIDLEDFSSLGGDGAAGVKGRRSTGLLAALGAAVLFDLAGNATQILTGSETQDQGDLGALIAGATGNATSRVAERYMGHLIDGGPRFRVKPGAVMNVLVEQDMRLPAQQVRK